MVLFSIESIFEGIPIIGDIIKGISSIISFIKSCFDIIYYLFKSIPSPFGPILVSFMTVALGLFLYRLVRG